MADTPDDDEPETFVQKAVKVGLIAIPLMMYVSWAHKKFFPCPRVKCHQAPVFKTSIGKSKKNKKKGKCQDSQADKQQQEKKKIEDPCKDSSSANHEHEEGKGRDSKPAEPNHQDQLSWLCETNEKEPSKDEYMDYLKRSTSDCCKSVNQNDKGRNSNKTDSKQSKADPCQSNTESDTISPEAFDQLFEHHFQKCVDDFKQHKKLLEKELERIQEDCEVKLNNEKLASSKNGKYLECLTDLNLDKDFDCDPNFHSKDSDATYVVKDYKCKATKGKAFDCDPNFHSKDSDATYVVKDYNCKATKGKPLDCDPNFHSKDSDANYVVKDYKCKATKGKAKKEIKSDIHDSSRAGYLECLTDLNMDKHFDCDPNFHSKDSDAKYVVKDYKCKTTKGNAKKEIKSDKHDSNKAGFLECLTDLNMDKHFEEKQETHGYYDENSSKNECCPSSSVKMTDECETDSYNKKDSYAQKTHEEELCKNAGGHKSKGKLKQYNSYSNSKMDDCGCDPHFNTKDTDKYGNIKGDPCTYESAREDDTDDDALKDFWHACGPPKGLRTGCQAEGCNDPCAKRK